MSKAIRIHANGGPEVLKWEQLPTPQPGPNEALIHHEAVGLNYIDVYFRTGLYKAPLPCTIGLEGAGTVLAVGENVHGLAPGERVAYAGGPLGAYATERVIAADRLMKLPPEISFTTAAAMMLQGITAHFLLHRTFKVQPGQTILLHAAAGGVGLIMCQWAKSLGVNVIGVVSTAEKAALAKANGAAHTIIGHANLAADVKKITGGAMVPVVYDSVGKDTFNASLFLTRPTFATYTAARTDLAASAAALFAAVSAGAVKIQVNQTFALQDAAAAHTALEARQTTGSTVLIP